jgi:hypothetical protein
MSSNLTTERMSSYRVVHSQEILCSVWTKRVNACIARLPEPSGRLIAAMKETLIGPQPESCTVVYHGEPVFVADID